MTLKTLLELQTYHLNEALRPRGPCDLVAFAQAKWHLEVANQAADFAAVFTKAFPALKAHAEALTQTTECGCCERSGHGALVG